MKPGTYRQDDQLKQSHARSLGHSVDPVVGHYGVHAPTSLEPATRTGTT
jgi:hypothetical protein